MTDEQRTIITRMRREGQGYTAVAAAAGLSKESVKAFCRRNGIGGVCAASRTDPETPPLACRNCGAPLTQMPGRKPRRFCCDDCRVRWWNTHPGAVRKKAIYSFICPGCGKSFTAYGNSGRKYCSHACYISHRFKGGSRP